MNRFLSLVLTVTMLLPMCLCTSLVATAADPSYPKDFELLEISSFSEDGGYEYTSSPSKNSRWYNYEAQNITAAIQWNKNGEGGFYISGSDEKHSGSKSAYVKIPADATLTDGFVTYTHGSTTVKLKASRDIQFHHFLRDSFDLTDHDVFFWSAYVKYNGPRATGEVYKPLYIKTENNAKTVAVIEESANGYTLRQYKDGSNIATEKNILFSDISASFDKNDWHEYGIAYDSVNKQTWYFIDGYMAYTAGTNCTLTISGKTMGVTDFPCEAPDGTAITCAVDDVKVRAYDYRVFNPLINLNLKIPSVVPCEKDSVDFVYSVSDYEKLIDGKDTYLSFERDGIELASSAEFKSDGSFTDSKIKRGENKYKVYLKNKADDAVILSSGELKVTATEIKPNILFKFKDYNGVSSINSYVGEGDVNFEYEGKNCDELVADNNVKLVIYSDGSDYRELSFNAVSGNLSIPVSPGEHSYYLSLKNGDTEVASSGILKINGMERQYDLKLDIESCSDGDILPTGSAVSVRWYTNDCEKLLENTSIRIYNSSDEPECTSSAQNGICKINIDKGQNKIYAKIIYNGIELISNEITLNGISIEKNDINIYKSYSYEEEPPSEYEPMWYITGTGFSASGIKQNEGNIYLKGKDASVGSVHKDYTAYAKIKDSYSFEGKSYTVTGTPQLYHQGRASMNIEKNDYFIYSAYVKNTGRTNDASFIPLAVRHGKDTCTCGADNKSMVQMKADATGINCIQYKTCEATSADYEAVHVNYIIDSGWHKYTIAYDAWTGTSLYFVDDVLIARTGIADSGIGLYGTLCGFSNFPKPGSDEVIYAVDGAEIVARRAYFDTKMYLADTSGNLIEPPINDGAVDVVYKDMTLALKFNVEMKEESMAFVKATANGISLTPLKYDKENSVYIFKETLQPYTVYDIDVSSAATKSGTPAKGKTKFTFTTKKAPFSIYSALENGDKIDVRLNNENNENKEVLLFAAYTTADGKILRSCAKMKIASVTDGQSYELDIGAKPSGSKLRVMLLSFNNLNYIDMLEQ